jgi:hypothetical protein
MVICCTFVAAIAGKTKRKPGSSIVSVVAAVKGK